MTKLVVGGFLIFGAGYISGQYNQSRITKKRLLKVLPLVEKSLIDVISKGIDNGFNEEEMKAALTDDFKFIKLVTGE